MDPPQRCERNWKGGWQPTKKFHEELWKQNENSESAGSEKDKQDFECQVET